MEVKCTVLGIRKFEDYKWVIGNLKSKKDRQHNGNKKMDKSTDNDLQIFMKSVEMLIIFFFYYIPIASKFLRQNFLDKNVDHFLAEVLV